LSHAGLEKFELDNSFEALRWPNNADKAQTQETEPATVDRLSLLELMSPRGDGQKTSKRDAVVDEKILQELAESPSDDHRTAATAVKQLVESESAADRINGWRLLDMLAEPKQRTNAIAVAGQLETGADVAKCFQILDDKRQSLAGSKVLSMLTDEDWATRSAGSGLISALNDPKRNKGAESVLLMLNRKETQDTGAKLWQQLGYAPQTLEHQLALLADPKEQATGKLLLSLVTSDDQRLAAAGTNAITLLASRSDEQRKDGLTLVTMLNKPTESEAAKDLAGKLSDTELHRMLELRSQQPQSQLYANVIKLLKEEDGDTIAPRLIKIHESPLARDQNDAARLGKMLNGQRSDDAMQLLRSEKFQNFDHRTALIDRLTSPDQWRGAHNLQALTAPSGRRNRDAVDPSMKILDMLCAEDGSKDRIIGERLFKLLNASDSNNECVAAVASKLSERTQLGPMSELMANGQHPEAVQTLQLWLAQGGRAASGAQNFLAMLSMKDSLGLADTEKQQMMKLIADKDSSVEAIAMLNNFGSAAELGSALRIRTEAPAEFKRMITSGDFADAKALERVVAMVKRSAGTVQNPYVAADAPKVTYTNGKFEYEIGPHAKQVLKMMADPSQHSDVRKLLQQTEGKNLERLTGFLSKPETQDIGKRLISMLPAEHDFVQSILKSGIDGPGAKRVVDKLMNASGKLEPNVSRLMRSNAGETLNMMLATDEPAMNVASTKVLKMLGHPSEAAVIRSILNVSQSDGMPLALELLQDPGTSKGIISLAKMANDQQEKSLAATESGERAPRTTAALTAMFMLRAPSEALQASAKNLVKLLSDPARNAAVRKIIEGIDGNSQHIAKMTELLQDQKYKASCDEFIKILAKPGFSETFGNKGLQLLERMDNRTPGADKLFEMLGDPKAQTYAHAVIDRFEFVSQATAYIGLTEVDSRATVSQRNVAATLKKLFNSSDHIDQRGLENLINVHPTKPYGQKLLSSLGDENAATRDTALAIAKLGGPTQCELAVALPTSKSFSGAGAALVEMLQSKNPKESTAAALLFDGLFQERAELGPDDVSVSGLFSSSGAILKRLNDPKTQESTKAALALVETSTNLRSLGVMLSGEEPEKAVEGLLAISKQNDSRLKVQALLQNGMAPPSVQAAIELFNDPKRSKESDAIITRLLSDSTKDTVVAENLLVGLSAPQVATQKAAQQLLSMLLDESTEPAAALILRNGRDPSTFMRIYNDKNFRTAADFILEQVKEPDDDFADWSIANSLLRMWEEPAGPRHQAADELLRRLCDPEQQFHAYRSLRLRYVPRYDN
jgi:hypothetical protein